MMKMWQEEFAESTYDKAAFEKIMFAMLNPLKTLYTPEKAGLQIGETGTTYNRRTIQMEGFSRPLWALAPYWMGGGKDSSFAEIYRKGLIAGTDPDNSEYWGNPGDYDQRFVEMAAIACAILEVPAEVWTPLTNLQKSNLAAWLNTINQHQLPGCNWLFFMILVNLALDSVGMPCDLQNMHNALEETDKWYRGDGWYTDGPAGIKPQSDYYIPWALQYYGILYSVFGQKNDPERAEIYRQRAVEFGRQFAYWFDENGAALPYGRSLTYRFGQCAFYSVCIFAGIEPLPLAVMKGIIVRNLNWWLSHKIFDRDGVLTIGYCYPQMYMAEQYNAPGSPYWGMKTFILMALPKEHPFWHTEPLPLPSMKPLMVMKSADMLMQRLQDGQVNAYTAGVVEEYSHGQFPEKYSKFVYNTRFGFSASRSYDTIEQTAPDSMLAFVIDGHVFVRRHCESFEIRENCMISVWHPFMGITVTTCIFPNEQGHVRKHTIESNISCLAYDCGFAVPRYAKGFCQEAAADKANAQNEQLGCMVICNHDNNHIIDGKGVIIGAFPNTCLYDPCTVIPAIQYSIPAGTIQIETAVTTYTAQ